MNFIIVLVKTNTQTTDLVFSAYVFTQWLTFNISICCLSFRLQIINSSILGSQYSLIVQSVSHACEIQVLLLSNVGRVSVVRASSPRGHVNWLYDLSLTSSAYFDCINQNKGSMVTALWTALISRQTTCPKDRFLNQLSNNPPGVTDISSGCDDHLASFNKIK